MEDRQPFQQTVLEKLGIQVEREWGGVGHKPVTSTTEEAEAVGL